jgi:aldose 1-epimerase
VVFPSSVVSSKPVSYNKLRTTDNGPRTLQDMTSHVIEIFDGAGGSSARILASLGFNCFSWRPALADGPREMLWADAEFERGDKRPSGSGVPLLFPFPGRIGGAAYTFQGRHYQLEPGDAFGNAIHGFVFNRPWRVVEQSDGRAVGEFQASVDDRSILERWPADFRIRVSYEVRGNELISDIRYENTGGGPLPCGFGTHAYFRLPLTDGSDAERTLIHAPVKQVWESEQMLPTGRMVPATGDHVLASGGPLAGRKFDTYFTALEPGTDGMIRTRITDPANGRVVTQTFPRAFTQCVVYTPPHRQAICLEPYTCLPDPFRMTAAGHDTGWQVLAPREAFETAVRIAVR